MSDDELAWSASDVTPLQEPKLSANEANHITKTLAVQATTVCLMTGAGRELVTFADLFHRPTWQTRAGRRGVNSNFFFPALGESTAAAKAVCASCEVRVECLDAALADEATEGIWGGVGRRFADRCGGGVRWRKTGPLFSFSRDPRLPGRFQSSGQDEDRNQPLAAGSRSRPLRLSRSASVGYRRKCHLQPCCGCRQAALGVRMDGREIGTIRCRQVQRVRHISVCPS